MDIISLLLMFLFLHSTKIFDKYIDNTILNNFHLFILLITQLHKHIILFTRQSVEVILIFYANFFCTNMNLSHANFFFTQFSCQFYRVILILIGTIIFTKYFYYLLIQLVAIIVTSLLIQAVAIITINVEVPYYLRLVMWLVLIDAI